ncbi:MAG: ATP-binding protein [Dehalococcoidales bacterium]|nr:ATP-binding protein [Dehalococcoidales bacterium]
MDTWSDVDELEETPSNANCPLCNGAGFVHPLLPSGQPDYSQVVPCHCIKMESDKDNQAHLLQYSNLQALSRFTFNNLIPQGRNGNPINQEQFKQAYEAAKAFAKEPKGWLILCGPSNCGKTHLAAAIANDRISRGQLAYYISTPDLLDRLRSSYNASSEISYNQFFDQVRNAPLLILDDLGTQSSTPWAKEKLDQLLNHRYNGELPTIIVTITPIEQLDDRIRSRLTDPNLSHVFIVETRQTLSEYSWEPGLELQKNMTFDKYDWRRFNLLPEQRDNLDKAFHLAFDFAKSPEGWLVFMGTTGCGKTHLAAAIVNHRYQAGKPALFIVVPDFLDHLRSTFSPDSKISYDQVFEKVKTAPLLILDDFGEQSTTPWAREKLYQVINYRYNACLPTVITTRYSLQEILEEIESSISSRLVDPKISTPFNIIAPDYRGDLQASPKKSSRTNKRRRWS